MYNFLLKHGQLVAFGVGLLIVVLFYLMATAGMGDFNALAKEERGTTSIFNFGLGAAIGLVILCAIAMLLFAIYQVATNPKAAMKGIIGLGVIILVFLLLYFTSSTDANASLSAVLEKFSITDGQHKYVNAAISTTGILGALAILAFIYSEVRNLIK